MVCGPPFMEDRLTQDTIPGDAGRRVCEDSLYCLIFLQIHNCWKIQSLHKGGQEGGLG